MKYTTRKYIQVFRLNVVHTCNPKRHVVFESIQCMFEELNKIVDVLKSHHCGL